MWTPQKVVFFSSRHPFSYFNARDLFGKTGFRLIILTELNITGTSVCEWMFSFTTGFICFTRGINSHSVRTADELCDLTCPRRVQLNLGVSVGGVFFFYNLSKPTSSSRQSTWTNVSSVSVMFESSQPFLVILCVCQYYPPPPCSSNANGWYVFRFLGVIQPPSLPLQMFIFENALTCLSPL